MLRFVLMEPLALLKRLINVASLRNCSGDLLYSSSTAVSSAPVCNLQYLPVTLLSGRPSIRFSYKQF
jgi:hypothetical protein